MNFSMPEMNSQFYNNYLKISYLRNEGASSGLHNHRICEAGSGHKECDGSGYEAGRDYQQIGTPGYFQSRRLECS